MESKILDVSFSDRKAYENIEAYVQEDDFVGISKILWEGICEFYSVDKDASHVDREVFLSRIDREYPKVTTIIGDLITEFGELSIPNVVKEICEFKKYQTSLELSSALLTGRATVIRNLIEQWERFDQGIIEATNEDLEVYHELDVETLINPSLRENLIKLYPHVLNERVEGGVPRGTSIAIYSRPEVGKSLLSINMSAGFCRDGHKTLYIGNEDPSSQMLLRFISRMSGMNKYQVIKSPREAHSKALEKGYRNLIFASLSPGTLKEIEKLISKYEPTVLVVDQVRNLNVGAEGLIQQLEKAANRIRTLGKKYNLVTIQVTQAGDSATDKLVLAMNDVDNSKTGFQAAFDLMIGIGSNFEYEASNRRVISITKNKITSDHSYFNVTVDKSISKVGSV